MLINLDAANDGDFQNRINRHRREIRRLETTKLTLQQHILDLSRQFYWVTNKASIRRNIATTQRSIVLIQQMIDLQQEDIRMEEENKRRRHEEIAKIVNHFYMYGR